MAAFTTGVGVITVGASIRFGTSDFPHATVRMAITGIAMTNDLNFTILVTQLI